MTTLEFVNMIQGSKDQTLVVKNGDVYYEVQQVSDQAGYCLLLLGGQYMPQPPEMLAVPSTVPLQSEETIPEPVPVFEPVSEESTDTVVQSE